MGTYVNSVILEPTGSIVLGTRRTPQNPARRIYIIGVVSFEVPANDIICNHWVAVFSS